MLNINKKNFALIVNNFVTRVLFIKPDLGYRSNLLPKIIKRFYPGANLPKILYKGVSGSFTQSDAVFAGLMKNKGVLPAHVVHYLSNLNHVNANTVQTLYDSIPKAFLTKDSFYCEKQMEVYGTVIDNSKPFNYLLPWNQNFLAHSTYTKVFDIKNVKFLKDNIPIDASSYADTGMTSQNLLEISVMKPVLESFYENFIKTNHSDNIKIELNNPQIQNNTVFTSQISKIQPNPDAIVKLYTIKNGIEQEPLVLQKTMPMDAKIINDPSRKLSPLIGNISISNDIEDFMLYFNRVFGSLTDYAKKKNSAETVDIKYYLTMLDNLKKELQKSISQQKQKGIEEYNILYVQRITEFMSGFYNLMYDMLQDSKIIDIFPSILVFNTQRTTTVSTLINTQEYLKYLETINNKEKPTMYSQMYFPVMGKENEPAYRDLIFNDMEKFPQPLKDILKNNLITFLDSVDKLAVTWK